MDPIASAHKGEFVVHRKKEKDPKDDGETRLPITVNDDNAKEKTQHNQLTGMIILQLTILVSLGTYFYFLSLEGGTDIWILKNLKKIGACLVLSLICYEYAFFKILCLSCKPWQKAGLFVATALALYATVEYDQGITFERHGEYNMFAFALLFSVSSSAIITVNTIRKYRLYRLTAAIGFILFLVVSVKAINAYHHYGVALLKERVEFEHPGCSIPHITPWVDILPRRMFNFFTGSETCRKVKSFSTLVDGVLTVDCPAADKPYYIINPDFARRDQFIEFHEGSPIETSDIQRLWTPLKYKELRRDYTEPVLITEGESIQVFCGSKQNYHIQNVKRQELVESSKEKTEGKDLPNILMIFIDSVSQAHFQRRLPKTAKTVELLDESKHGAYKLVQLLRYHALSQSTPGNVRALFTGYTSAEMQDENPPTDAGDFLMWKRYRDAGYVTLWADNFCQDYFKHYMRINVTHLDYEAVLPFCHRDYTPEQKTFSNFRGGPYSIEKRCIVGKYVHEYELDYVEQFYKNYAEVPKFSVVSLSEAHEASGAVIALVDDRLSKTLSRIMSAHPNTLLFIYADHGLHIGPYALTPAGDVENRLPLHVGLYPLSWLDKHPHVAENLMENQQRLTTHMDVHQAITHMLPEYQPAPRDPKYTINKAVSIFDKVPNDRTCDDAGIPEKLCICTVRE